MSASSSLVTRSVVSLGGRCSAQDKNWFGCTAGAAEALLPRRAAATLVLGHQSGWQSNMRMPRL